MAAAHVINFYLDDERKEEKEHLCQLAKEDTPESDAKVLAYVYEALRLDPQGRYLSLSRPPPYASTRPDR